MKYEYYVTYAKTDNSIGYVIHTVDADDMDTNGYGRLSDDEIAAINKAIEEPGFQCILAVDIQSYYEEGK